ncbi:hypothetical protein MTY66_31600 [Mycolicibacterium sp. TY66]|jgi:hypothetical protein|nr:hypothetical protein [Mycolicibacterium mucogenicum]BCI81535.1 hypothetical protein MTY66_31600 [Mycolicibacterium sp. TY66]BCJ80810.1 hypothetical protein MTY81_21830 [Mycolicibacterium sp. TY81]
MSVTDRVWVFDGKETAGDEDVGWIPPTLAVSDPGEKGAEID